MKARFSASPRRLPPRRIATAVVALFASALAAGLAGCSAAIPLPSFISQDDVTGSIRKPVSPLSPDLDAEDWRRASAALAVALDPQGNGAPVRWDNPASGMNGVFVPVGEAHPVDGRICRAFVSELAGPRPDSVQATGCRDQDGDWTVRDVRPWKKA